MLNRNLIFLLACLCPLLAFAQQDAGEARAQALFAELRCVVCEGQPLADSGAEVAADIRAAVRAMVAEGKSDTEIKSLLVTRYGETVLMVPPLSAETFMLWLGPLVMVGLALGIVFAYFSSARLTRK